jgi:hypothetical protein
MNRYIFAYILVLLFFTGCVSGGDQYEYYLKESEEELQRMELEKAQIPTLEEQIDKTREELIRANERWEWLKERYPEELKKCIKQHQENY